MGFRKQGGPEVSDEALRPPRADQDEALRVEPQDEALAVVGRVLGPWGRQGAVKVEPLTDVPGRLSPGHSVLLRGEPVTIREGRRHRARLVLSFVGVDSVEQAERLRGELLSVPKEKAPPLEEGSYYHFQLLGLKVWTAAGECLGKVKEIIPTGANDVYVVAANGRELLLPAIEDVIKEVDLDGGRIVVELIEGLA